MFRARYMRHGLDAFMQFIKFFCLFLFFCKVIISTIFVSSLFLVMCLVLRDSVSFGEVCLVLVISFFLSIVVIFTFTNSPLECFGDTDVSTERNNDG